MKRNCDCDRKLSSAARDIVDGESSAFSRSLPMTWRRSLGPEPTIHQSEQSGFARVVPAVAPTPTSGQMVTDRG